MNAPPRRHWLRAVVGALMLLGCAADAPVEGTDSAVTVVPPVAAPPAPPDLIDSMFPPAVAGEDGWNYQRSVTGDLTGDGQPERVVMTARVELIRGQPAWDDGQPWQVYVESASGNRTYVYAQRLQLGTLTLRMSKPDSTDRVSVVLLEHLPDRIRVLEVDYPDATGAPRVVLRFERLLDARGENFEP